MKFRKPRVFKNGVFSYGGKWIGNHMQSDKKLKKTERISIKNDKNA
jgi:hypothetical protein